MEIGTIVQRQKLALLQGGKAAQLGNQSLVNRLNFIES